MKMIINPGSEITKGDLIVAADNAVKWLSTMILNGICDVQVNLEGKELNDNRWRFDFKHKITGVIKELDMHGFTEDEIKLMTFPPRTYWDGSSCVEPTNEDFLKTGYSLRIVKDDDI